MGYTSHGHVFVMNKLVLREVVLACTHNLSFEQKLENYSESYLLPKHLVCFCNVRKMHWLTYLTLASILWDIGKQYIPRCDAAECGVPSGAILFAYRNLIEKWNKILKSHLRPLSGLTQLIMMGESIRQIWVNWLRSMHTCI